MLPHQIIMLTPQRGYSWHRVRMLVTEHTSDDPQFPCGDYTTEVHPSKFQLKLRETERNQVCTFQATYNDCHLREASLTLQASIGCVPHWFSAPGMCAIQPMK